MRQGRPTDRIVAVDANGDASHPGGASLCRVESSNSRTVWMCLGNSIGGACVRQILKVAWQASGGDADPNARLQGVARLFAHECLPASWDGTRKPL